MNRYLLLFELLVHELLTHRMHSLLYPVDLEEEACLQLSMLFRN